MSNDNTGYEKTIRVVIGYVVASMDGDKLIIQTDDDEMITMVIKDKALRRDFYGKNVIVTIETTEHKLLSQVLNENKKT